MLRMAVRGLGRTLGLLPRRPFGVTLLAIGFLLGGLVLMAFGLFDVLRSRGNSADAGSLDVIRGGLFVVASFGLWDLRRWGWALAIVLAALSLFLALGNALWMLVWAAVAIYLVLVHAVFFRTFWQRARRALAGPARH